MKQLTVIVVFIFLAIAGPQAADLGLKVTSLRFDKSDEPASDQAKISRDGMTLSLEGVLPEGEGVVFSEGKAEKAVSDKGKDLLKDEKQGVPPGMNLSGLSAGMRRMIFGRGGQEQAGPQPNDFTFDVYCELPDKGTQSIKELSGYVKYFKCSGSKTVDLGFQELSAGAAGTELNAKLERAINAGGQPNAGAGGPAVNIPRPPQGGGAAGPGGASAGAGGGIPGRMSFVTISLEIEQEKVKDIKVYDTAGNPVDFKYNARQAAGIGIVNRYAGSAEPSLKHFFNISGSAELPKDGKIKVELYEKVEEVKAPFKLADVPLVIFK